MSTSSAVNTNRAVPHFDNEADEARWWFEHKDLIEQDFEDAFDNGTIGSGRSLRYTVDRSALSVPVVLDPADITLARELAARTGESFEDFVRRVVHQALELEKTA